MLDRALVRRMTPLVVGAALAGLYLSTLTSGNTYDAVIYALFVERAVSGAGITVDFFNPAHVFHLPFATGITWLMQSCGVAVGGMLILQILAALSGAGLGALMFARLEEEAGTALALATAAAAALYAGTWFFATDGETNHLGLVLAVAALGPLRSILQEAEAPRRRTIAAAGLLLGGAAMFHLTIGTLWIAFLVLALLRHRSRLVPVVSTLTVASLLLALAYVPRVVMLVRHAPEWRLANLLSFHGETVRGAYLLRSGFRPWDEWLSVAASASPGEDTWSLVSRAGPWLWLLAGVIALIRSRARRDREMALLALSGLWFVVSLVLFAAWGNTDFEFTCFMSTPLAVLGACGAASLLPGARGRTGAAAVQGVVALVIGVAAWRGTIAPQLEPASNPFRRQAEEVRVHTGPADIVLASEVTGNRSKVYIPYFALRKTVMPEFHFGTRITTEESVRRLMGKLRECCDAGGRVHVLPELLEPLKGPDPWWDLAAVRAALLELEPEPAVVDPADGHVVLYRLRRCPE